MVVEYLVVINKLDAFCSDAASFNRLLQVNSAISLKKGHITFSDNFECGYQITGGEVSGREQLYFHLKFTKDFEGTISDDDLDSFIVFLKTIREVISKAGGQATTLWDDISYHFSQKAYSVVYEIENLMRKLIANFMLITVGKDWVSETTPNEIKEVVNKNKRNDYANVLHSVDFIDLADFLLKPYSNKGTQELYKKLQAAETAEDLKELKEFVPASNWKRYFSSLVKCEDAYLQKRWSDLYELRCKVAHNAIFARHDYQDIVRLADELRPKLTDAISKLPQVSMAPEERESVAENAAGTLSTLFGSFISAWRVVETYLDDLLNRHALERKSQSFSQSLDVLRIHGLISPEHHNRLHWLMRLRNKIVHEGTELPEENVRAAIMEIHEIAEEIGVASYDVMDQVAKLLLTTHPDASITYRSDDSHIFVNRGQLKAVVRAQFIPLANTAMLQKAAAALDIGRTSAKAHDSQRFVLAMVGGNKTTAESLVEIFHNRNNFSKEMWIGYMEGVVFVPITDHHITEPLFKMTD